MNFKNSIKNSPIITITIIAINIIVFILQTEFIKNNILLNGELIDFIKYGALDFEAIKQGEYWRYITSVFLHKDNYHLMFNMFALYSFGSFIEKQFSKTKFISIYLISGLIANFASVLFSSTISIGASGAIFGLIGFYFTIIYDIFLKGDAEPRGAVRLIFINLAIVFIPMFIIPNINIISHFAGTFAGIAMFFVFIRYNISVEPLNS